MDVGWYRIDQPVGSEIFHVQLIRCECKANDDAQRLQRLSGLTDREKKLRLDDIECVDRPGTRAMVNACEMFISYPFSMTTFWGGSGNGKTIALQAVVNDFVSRKVEAVYVTAFDLISYIRSSFNLKREVIDDNAYARLLRFEQVNVLAIDEFDKISVTDWVQEQFTDLIDRRYRLALDKQCGTLIAMNDDPRNQPSWIYSRLSQGVILFNSDDDIRPCLVEVTHPLTGEIFR